MNGIARKRLMTKYISTRGGNETVSGAAAIIKGLASNKGLFVPTEIPKLPLTIEEMVGKDYKEIALIVLKSFFDDFSDEELRYCIESAYDDKFEKKEIVPIVQAGAAHFIELFHGKTAAFKDIALSILPYLMTTAIKKEGIDKKICILTATSGDTGKAALEGFSDVEGTEIIVFYPYNAVSKIQELQMTTQEGANTHVFAIRGNFDDAERGVKSIFTDKSFAEALSKQNILLSSANSINIGRLVPQVAYYVYAYLKLLEEKTVSAGEPMNVVVPTGNFGNILAAYYAKMMGIPIRTFICASNKNKVLTDFFATGVYDVNREFYVTNSPSMDILISSNLERLLFHLNLEAYGNQNKASEQVLDLMTALETNGRYEVSEEIKNKMGMFVGGFTDQEYTLKTIQSMYNKHEYLMDTHTAVAYDVYSEYIKHVCDDFETVIAATASPYKFPASVAKAIGINDMSDDFEYLEEINKATGVNIPGSFVDLQNKTVLHDTVIEKDEMKDAVLDSLKIASLK